jgi:hypothetical protein
MQLHWLRREPGSVFRAFGASRDLGRRIALAVAIVVGAASPSLAAFTYNFFVTAAQTSAASFNVKIGNLANTLDYPWRAVLKLQVPTGLAITSWSLAPGWTCNASVPVTASTVTCTFMSTNTLWTANLSWTHSFKTSGTGKVCANLHAHTKWGTATTWTQVQETTNANNHDCLIF